MKDNNDFIKFARKGNEPERISGVNSICYSRVSSKEQELGYSLETQKKAIQQFAEKNNLKIIEYFGGTYESAKNDERKHFKMMLDFARKSKEKISYILVYSVDRFSRSGANAIYIASELRKENIKVLAVTQPADTATPSGKLQQNIQFIFSEYDNDLRREKCVAGMREKLSQGYWVNKQPLGFDMITSHRYQKITVNKTGKILRKAFYWKADDNLSNIEIQRKLFALGVKISDQQLTEMFRNPFYCGKIRHNLLPGQIIEGKHEKLIPEEVFLRINGSAKRIGITFKDEFEFTPLKHFLKCGECGTPFSGYIVKKKNLYYYKCNRKGCKCNRSAKLINSLFEDYLGNFQIEERWAQPLKNEFIDYISSVSENSRQNEKQLKSQLTVVEKKIEAIEERYITGEIDKELYDKFSAKFKVEKRNIQKEMDDSHLDLSNLEKQVQSYIELCLKLPSLWARGSYNDKTVIQNLIFPEGILYDRRKNDYRTPRINSVISCIAIAAKGLKRSKKRKTAKKGGFSGLVGPLGIEPSTHRL
jgi:site-specific DNA recombinase